MLEEIRLRNYSPHTQRAYIRCLANFAKHFGTAPDRLGPNHIRQYELFLVEEKTTSWASFNQRSAHYVKLRLLPLARRPSNSAIRAAICSGVRFVSLAIVSSSHLLVPPDCRLNVDAKAAGVYSVTRAKSVAKHATDQRQASSVAFPEPTATNKIDIKSRPIERGRSINLRSPPPQAGCPAVGLALRPVG